MFALQNFMDITNTNLKREFGNRLRKTRKCRGFATAAIFASLIEEEANTVTMWERGDRYPPPYQLQKIIKVLRITSDYLLFGNMGGLTQEATTAILGKQLLYSNLRDENVD